MLWFVCTMFIHLHFARIRNEFVDVLNDDDDVVLVPPILIINIWLTCITRLFSRRLWCFRITAFNFDVNISTKRARKHFFFSFFPFSTANLAKSIMDRRNAEKKNENEKNIILYHHIIWCRQHLYAKNDK